MQVVVHQASPRAVDAVLQRLHEHDVEAIAVDAPNAIALLVAFGTYRVRIAVPEEQAERARDVLEEWNREAAPRLQRLGSELLRQLVLASAIAALAGLAYLLVARRLGARGGGQESDAFALVVVVSLAWVAALMGLAVVHRLRQGAGRGG